MRASVLTSMADSGDLTTFGAALDSIGFWGASRLNPNDMCNNCVSVSLARMLNYDNVEKLWQALYGAPLPDAPLTFDQVLEMVGRTNHRWKWTVFAPRTRTLDWTRAKIAMSAHDHFVWSCAPNFNTQKALQMYGWRDEQMSLLLYIREDGTGHCINAISYCKTTRIRDHHGVVWDFRDFQHDNNGQPDVCLEEVKQATRIVVLYWVTPKWRVEAERGTGLGGGGRRYDRPRIHIILLCAGYLLGGEDVLGLLCPL